MNTAAKGRRNEHRSMDYLNKHDYYTLRSAGSHGAVDLIGFKIQEGILSTPQVRIVQSKTHGKFSDSDLTTLRMLRTISHKSVMSTLNLILDELTPEQAQKVALLLVSVFNPRFELHNWEKFHRYPEITVLGDTRDEDIHIIDE